MEIQVLGAHQLETRHTRHSCFLIDNVLAVDAGSLASALSAEEQAQVRAVLLTHRHFDHCRDIPTLGLNTLDDPTPIDVYALPETLMAVHTNLLNWTVYPDFTGKVTSDPPKFRFHSVEPGLIFRAMDYQVKPISVPHSAPTVGYIVKSDAGGCVAYSADTGGDLLPFFQDQFAPQVFFVEVTFPDRLAGLAQTTGHLTPSALRDQLLAAMSANLSLPKMVAVHINPHHRAEVTRHLAELREELGVDLMPGHEDMRLSV